MTEWNGVIPLDALPDGRQVKVAGPSEDLLLLRAGDVVYAVANRCTHQGAPLHRGVVRLSGSMHTVTCPAHGSVFSFDDGSVRRGPATVGLRAYDARVSGEIVEVRSQI